MWSNNGFKRTRCARRFALDVRHARLRISRLRILGLEVEIKSAV